MPAAIATPRLDLRTVSLEDARAVEAGASLREVADTMISIPHPYPPGEAARGIAARQAELAAGQGVAFAARRRTDSAFCGLAEIRDIDREHEQAELSFWLVPDAWGQGYMTEIVRALVAYGIETLGLNRLYAHHMVRNPASGRVLQKAGFQQEGVLRQRVRKWGRYEDVALWAILADARAAGQPGAGSESTSRDTRR